MLFSKALLRKALPLAICLTSAGWSPAAVTYVDPPDILIPFSFGGVYLNIITASESGSTSGGGADPSGDSFTISYSEPASGDWDVNFFVGGAGIVHNTTFQPYREDGSDNLSAIHSATVGQVVDGNAISPEPATGPSVTLTTPDFGGSGTGTSGGLDGSLADTHMGGAGDQFVSGVTAYIAFVLNPGGSEQYGWIRVTLADDGGTGLIHDWAFSDSPLAVGTVPEPSIPVIALVGLAGLMTRRRR